MNYRIAFRAGTKNYPVYSVNIALAQLGFCDGGTSSFCTQWNPWDSLRARSPEHSGGGAEKERELATASLEFKCLHLKSRCEMLIGGDDISNDVKILVTCFSMFVYIRARFRFALIGGNLTVQLTVSHRGIGGGIQTPET